MNTITSTKLIFYNFFFFWWDQAGLESLILSMIYFLMRFPTHLVHDSFEVSNPILQNFSILSTLSITLQTKIQKN